jgi:four helix bundle protein
MATIDRFEDLDCWKAARQLVKLSLEAVSEGRLSKDFDMRSQLIRASLSTMNNIAEGFGRAGYKDAIRFYDIAQCSSNEVKSMTYVFEDAEYIPLEKILRLRSQSEEAKALTLGLIRYLRRKYAPHTS